MKRFIATAAMLAAAGPACADAITLKPLVDLRIRYENVHQDGIAQDSDALTARLRGGLQATSGQISALVEAQGNVALDNHYYDGLAGAATRPLIGDPQNVALYRAELQYRSPTLTLTAGRQRIALDDERFVGATNFRQNGQTYDAARAEWTPIKGFKADLSYVWSDRTVWGISGKGARQQAVSGDSWLANLSYATPIGTIVGFAYLVDQDEAAVQNFALSSQTYGMRLAGSRLLSKTAKLSYQLSYASQSDYHRNPNNYRVDYYLADAGLDVRAVKLGAGYEVLGAANGVALTSFQTPIATTFKFEGWANKFLTTPPNGVRDLYGSVGYGWKQVGPAKAVSIQAIYHDFRSDRLDQHYGHEWDALASAKFGKTLASIRYADYRADAFATDTHKVWLEFNWSL